MTTVIFICVCLFVLYKVYIGFETGFEFLDKHIANLQKKMYQTKNNLLEKTLSNAIYQIIAKSILFLKVIILFILKYTFYLGIAAWISYAFYTSYGVLAASLSFCLLSIPIIIFKLDSSDYGAFALDAKNCLFLIKVLKIPFLKKYEPKLKERIKKEEQIKIDEAKKYQEQIKNEQAEKDAQRKFENDLGRLDDDKIYDIFNDFDYTLHEYENKLDNEMYVEFDFDGKKPSNIIHRSKKFREYEDLDKSDLDSEEIDVNHILYLLPQSFESPPKEKFLFKHLILNSREIPKIPDLPKFTNFFERVNKDEKLKEVFKDSYRRFKNSLNRYEELKKNIDEKLVQNNKIYKSLKKNIDAAKKPLGTKTASDAIAYLELADIQHYMPKLFKHRIDYFIDENSKVLLMTFAWLNFEDISFYRYVDYKSKKLTVNQKADILKKSLCSVVIRYIHLAAKYNVTNVYNSIAFNVESKWTDRSTGKIKDGVIASLFVKCEDAIDLNLSRIDPEASFKKFKGLITPSVSQDMSPLKPIYIVNKEDKRIVETKDVAGKIEEDANLAAMDWEDFESLVAQLFEWEFADQGNEIKVTQASRDKGIDAIMFDPDPIKGGKYVLQAKRYTNVVDVSAVRDLYGTMLDEGANKGIIITTSSYGKDAYDFAKDKPLSLVDGRNLLALLKKHGKSYKIDLAEAKKINKAREAMKRKST